MDPRAERIGKNEALFREVNERVRDVTAGFGGTFDDAEFVCECGDRGCTARIRVPLRDYERVRGDGALFLIKGGHEIPDVEDVVEEHETYAVVRKRAGDPAALARQADPRG